MSAPMSVRREWSRRVEAEYASSAIAQHLVLWLIQLGAPRELLDDGLRIVSDELDHAQLCAEVSRAAGTSEPPKLAREMLGLGRPPGGALELHALAACVRFFCLGETVAVPLFKELRAECEQPLARKVLDRVLRDEVRHRQFGWDLLDYFEQSLPGTVDHVEAMLPGMFRQLEASYGSDREHTVIGTEERAWGLMPRALYAAIFDETVGKEYVPRFLELGIDAEKAWRTRGEPGA